MTCATIAVKIIGDRQSIGWGRTAELNPEGFCETSSAIFSKIVGQPEETRSLGGRKVFPVLYNSTVRPSTGPWIIPKILVVRKR